MIGRNNAGKTTAVEALRLLSVVVSRFKHLNILDMSQETGIRALEACVAPSLRGTNVDLSHVCHQYGPPPAVVEATFDEGYVVTIYLTPENRIFGVIRDNHRRVFRHRSQASHFHVPSINVLPQVRPLLIDEEVRDEKYVRSSLTTDLSPLHFRNQLRLFDSYYDAFVEMAEGSWPGLRIRELTVVQAEGGDPLLSLLVQDGRFVAEVGRMGHGLQIWLQAIWFLARSEPNQTLILDEPDVYLHADLQRRLVRQLVARPNQIIMTSHAVDVLSEVAPEQILVVDKTQPNSSFTTSVPAVQTVIDHIGTTHNVQLARLWNARRLLLVEGKDLYLLKCFQDILYLEARDPLDGLPNMSIGGWGGWNYAIGSSMLMKNAIGQDVVAYCVLDSVYRSSDEIAERIQDAKTRGVQLHIWKRKEIENYILEPEAICRAISIEESKRRCPDAGEIKECIEMIADDLKDDIVDTLVELRMQRNRKLTYKSVIGPVRDYLGQHWGSFEGKTAIVPGKKLVSRLFESIQREFGVSLSQGRVARALRRNEVPDEVKGVVDAIEHNRHFRG